MELFSSAQHWYIQTANRVLHERAEIIPETASQHVNIWGMQSDRCCWSAIYMQCQDRADWTLVRICSWLKVALPRMKLDGWNVLAWESVTQCKERGRNKFHETSVTFEYKCLQHVVHARQPENIPELKVIFKGKWGKKNCISVKELLAGDNKCYVVHCIQLSLQVCETVTKQNALSHSLGPCISSGKHVVWNTHPFLSSRPPVCC